MIVRLRVHQAECGVPDDEEEELDGCTLHCLFARGLTMQAGDRLRRMGYAVLCTPHLDPRRLALLAAAYACQALAALAAVHLALRALCGGVAMCYLCVSPPALLGAAVAVLLRMRRPRFETVKNGVLFFLCAPKDPVTLRLDTELRSKAYYGPNNGCPVSLLHCVFGGHRAVRIACYSLPRDRALHQAITCDVLDMLREYASAGLLIIQADPPRKDLLTFLSRSGLLILCNAEGCGTIVAMRPSPAASAEEVCVREGEISLRLRVCACT